MNDTIIFSEHASHRITERSSLSVTEILERLTKRVAVLICETLIEPRFRYCVLWDTKKGSPLLVILRKESEGDWVVVTVYETMTYQKRGHGIMVMPAHIKEAHKREVRFANKGRTQDVDSQYGHVRLHIIIRYSEYGTVKVRRHKIGSVPIEKFLSTHEGDAKKLVRYFIELGKMNFITVPADATAEAEVLKTENNNRTVISSCTLG